MIRLIRSLIVFVITRMLNEEGWPFKGDEPIESIVSGQIGLMVYGKSEPAIKAIASKLD